jgi:phage terminase large subunit GpA-like protein
MHLGQCSSDQFLDEIFPWKRRAKAVTGFTQYEWHLPNGSRDEAGDCTRMAYAALQLVARRYNRATMWDQLEASLTKTAATPQRQAKATPAQPSFLTNW